jgi:hypothetical protein
MADISPMIGPIGCGAKVELVPKTIFAAQLENAGAFTNEALDRATASYRVAQVLGENPFRVGIIVTKVAGPVDTFYIATREGPHGATAIAFIGQADGMIFNVGPEYYITSPLYMGWRGSPGVGTDFYISLVEIIRSE